MIHNQEFPELVSLPPFTIEDCMDSGIRDRVLYTYRNHPVELMSVAMELAFELNDDILTGASSIPQDKVLEAIYRVTEVAWVAGVIEYNENPSLFLKTSLLLQEERFKIEPACELIKWFATQMSLSGFEAASKQLNSRLQNFNSLTGGAA